MLQRPLAAPHNIRAFARTERVRVYFESLCHYVDGTKSRKTIMSNTHPNEDRATDTTINVAQLLKQQAGATRRYQLVVDELALGEDRLAHDLHGPIKLTRVGRGLLATGTVEGEVDLICARCLDEFSAPVEVELEDEFRPSIDVTSGIAVNHERNASATEGDYFLIDENHQLDLSEALRQGIWVGMPMMPLCREDCPGVEIGDDEATLEAEPDEPKGQDGDARLAVLRQLLEAPDEKDTR